MTSTAFAKRNRHYQADVTHNMQLGAVYFIKKWKLQDHQSHVFKH